MNKLERTTFRENSDVKNVKNYFLNPYVIHIEEGLEEETQKKDLGTGPRCI